MKIYIDFYSFSLQWFCRMKVNIEFMLITIKELSLQTIWKWQTTQILYI